MAGPRKRSQRRAAPRRRAKGDDTSTQRGRLRAKHSSRAVHDNVDTGTPSRSSSRSSKDLNQDFAAVTPSPPPTRPEDGTEFTSLATSLDASQYKVEAIQSMESERFNSLDFSKCSDEMLWEIFPQIRKYGTFSPPLSYRKSAKQMRAWRRLGNNQQREVLDKEQQEETKLKQQQQGLSDSTPTMTSGGSRPVTRSRRSQKEERDPEVSTTSETQSQSGEQKMEEEQPSPTDNVKAKRSLEPILSSKSAKRSKAHNGEEVVQVELLTGTLHLYRGANRRAEFIRRV